MTQIRSSLPHLLRRTRAMAVLLALAAAAACGDGGTGSRSAASAQPFSGNGQAGRVGQPLPNAVAVRVLDAQGAPVAGVEVAWTSAQGGAAEPATSRTGPDGIASVVWTLGGAVGTQTLVAKAGGVETSFTATASVGSTATLVAQPVVLNAVSQWDTLVVQGQDRFGNPTGVATIQTLDPHIVYSYDEGAVVAIARGTGRVQVSLDGLVDTVLVVVRQIPARITWNPALPVLAVGDTLHATALDSLSKPIPGGTWAVSGGATVDAAGVVRGTAPGMATLSFTQDGFTVQRQVEVILTVAAPTRSLSAGVAHTCGLTPDGVAYCWGFNDSGQTAPGHDYWEGPVRVRGDAAFRSVEAGVLTNCGITAGGYAECWGSDLFTRYRGTPSATGTRITNPGSPRQVAPGYYWACAVTSESILDCWNDQGFNSRPGPQGTAVRAIDIGVLSNATRFQGPERVCVLYEDGSIHCGTPFALRPVSSGIVFDRVTAGPLGDCALTAAGVAYCWGQALQSGTGGPTTSSATVPVAGGHTFRAIAMGRDQACAVDTDGQAWCWGANDYGQLGTGNTTPSTVPVAVQQGALRFTDITANGGPLYGYVQGSHTCAAGTDGEVYCWGSNATGQLGQPRSVTRSLVPVRVPRPRT